MSCSNAAQRNHSPPPLFTTLVNTSSVCQKLSLCARPPTVSTPWRAASSGNISSKSPVWNNSSKPIAGESLSIILCNSSIIRSPDIIFIRSRLRCKASSVSCSIVKFNCVAKRMQRIMRNGSSEKVMSGSNGVAMTRSCRSHTPSNGSTSSP